MRTHQFRPAGVDLLEGRLALSQLGATPKVAAAAAVAAAVPTLKTQDLQNTLAQIHDAYNTYAASYQRAFQALTRQIAAGRITADQGLAALNAFAISREAPLLNALSRLSTRIPYGRRNLFLAGSPPGSPYVWQSLTAEVNTMIANATAATTFPQAGANAAAIFRTAWRASKSDTLQYVQFGVANHLFILK